MKLNSTPRVGVNDPQLTRELREHATAINLLSDGRLSGTNNAATAAPTTGTHALGDFVRNSNPTGAAPTYGWLCTAGGTPGTWVAVYGGVSVAATNVAGGAANRIVYQTGAGASGFIVAPTVASTYLRWNAAGNAFEFGTPAGGAAAVKFRAYRSASYAFTNGAYTKVNLDAESFDSDGYFDSTTNYRFTPLVAGYYYFAWMVHAQDATTGVATQLRVNGTSVAEGSYAAINTVNTRGVGSEMVYLNGSTDYVELYAFMSGTVTLVGGATETRLIGYLVV